MSKYCDTCNNKTNEIWGTEDFYVNSLTEYDLVFTCDKENYPPKKGKTCSDWQEVTLVKKQTNDNVEAKHKELYAMEDWEQENEI